MIPLVLATTASAGAFLVVSAWLGGGVRHPAPSTAAGRITAIHTWLRQAGLERIDLREFSAAVVALFAMGGLVGHFFFGTVVPTIAMGLAGATVPIAAQRARRRTRRQRALEAWPRMIEEIRVHAVSLGRSIPQAVFDVGRRGPEELQPAFVAAHREWMLTTDLARTFAVLKDDVADATADVTCETLLIAHELGGTDLDRRLTALADDRLQDVQGRKDARSRQAGARFARFFVLLVPAGMALAGTSIGTGRSAYRSASGQIVVVIALVVVFGCWWWAGRLMRLPETERVFPG